MRSFLSIAVSVIQTGLFFLPESRASISLSRAAFVVKTDVQLAKVLGLTPQAIASAKRKRRIPSTWLKRVVEIGISIDYILKGADEQVGLDSRFVGPLTQAKRRGVTTDNEIGLKKIPLKRAHRKSYFHELEKSMAQNLVQLASEKSGLKFSDDLYKSMVVFVMMHILPENYDSIASFYKEIGDIEMPDTASEL